MSYPTKREMSALWSCIQDACEMTRHMKAVGCTDEQIEHSKSVNAEARRAYLKINKLRKGSKAPAPQAEQGGDGPGSAATSG